MANSLLFCRWFGETLTGLSTIRAYSQQGEQCASLFGLLKLLIFLVESGRFSANNEARLDRNNACFLPSVSVNRWLAVRLELLGWFSQTILRNHSSDLFMFSQALSSCLPLPLSRSSLSRPRAMSTPVSLGL